MNSNQVILCIPKVEKHISREYVSNIIKKMNIGEIEALHEIPLQNNQNYKRIIIRTKWDLSSQQSKRIYNTLSENKSIKIVHKMPWYWICVKYVKQGSKELKPGLDPSLSKIIHEN